MPWDDSDRAGRERRTLACLEDVHVKDESKRCIANLLAYRATRTRARLPRAQSAAVLVPLFVGRSGDLYVLLSRRSDALKAYSGDTALPGGKMDEGDRSVEDTARREAFEEIGLPRDEARVPLLCVMEPHLAKGEMVVTPVVVLVLDNSLQPNLNSSEVTSIFAQPLAAFLSTTRHFTGGRTADPNTPYHTFTDLAWSDGGTVRLHRFLTGREAEGVKPVFGLTAAILIKTATIGYARQPEFEVQPRNAPTSAQQIALALLTPANPLRVACDREGVDASEAAARFLRPLVAANAPRTIEWAEIGKEWKRLLKGDGAAEEGSGSGERAGPWGGGRSKGAGKRVEQIKKHVQGHVDGGGECAGGLDAKIEEYKKRALEHKEQTGESGEEGDGDALPDMAKLGAFLDKTRDMVNERMKEVKGDERKLAKARKTYPKVLEQVKKQLEEARNEDGKFDLKVLFAMIPKEGQESLQGGAESSKEEAKIGQGNVEGTAQVTQRGMDGVRRGLEGTRKINHIGDGHSPEQVHKKCGAKL